ncbi:hypothetical protein HYFRA_00011133 [Hymenoscyphus fraxineus]|uniref:Uncharacterized protein n=1 Tax=Hymenoscyphus fraxineus TaxID=746836 RepID=A0A9N9L4J7_9HELO|nr:hypothetical protein HYFRA_00011133 [Hymenoscyphus fraxineus]
MSFATPRDVKAGDGDEKGGDEDVDDVQSESENSTDDGDDDGDDKEPVGFGGNTSTSSNEESQAKGNNSVEKTNATNQMISNAYQTPTSTPNTQQPSTPPSPKKNKLKKNEIRRSKLPYIINYSTVAKAW